MDKTLLTTIRLLEDNLDEKYDTEAIVLLIEENPLREYEDSCVLS